MKGSHVSRFSKSNFICVIKQIEEMEQREENIWVPIGILEYMYDDDVGLIDYYFNQPYEKRDPTILFNNLDLQLRIIKT